MPPFLCITFLLISPLSKNQGTQKIMLNRKYRKILKISIPFIVLAAIVITNQPCDRECLKSRASNHKVRRIYFWQSTVDKPVIDNIGPAPDAVTRLVNIDNEINGYPTETIPAEKNEALFADIKHAYMGLPAVLQDYLEDKIAGIYLVKNLGGTGYTDVFFNKAGKLAGAFILLDVDAIDQTANDWATYKESSPFKQGPLRVEALIEATSENTRQNTMAFILLHEIGHIVGVFERAHPKWWKLPTKNSIRSNSFAKISWQFAPLARFAPLEKNKMHKDLVFYFGAQKHNSASLETYEILQQSSFITLYGATNVYDDFADSFAVYIHEKILKNPYFINIFENNLIKFSYKTCWGEPRCEQKEKYLDQLYKKMGPSTK